MTRIYEIRSTWGSDTSLICWGASRFGNDHDPEMQLAILADKVPGDGKTFCVRFTPVMPKFKSPEQVKKQRINNMKRRTMKKAPLFADQIIAREIERASFTLEDAEKSQNKRKRYMEKVCEDFQKEHKPELEVRL